MNRFQSCQKNKPRAVFVTNYELTREREDMLDDDCTKWLEKLEAAHGWEHISDATSFNPGASCGRTGTRPPPEVLQRNVRRALFELMAECVRVAPMALPGNHLFQSNISIPLCRRISSFLLYGKALKSLLGTKPIWRVTLKECQARNGRILPRHRQPFCASKAEASDWRPRQFSN